MGLLAVKQIFDQELLINGYISLNITGVIFKKEVLIIDINNQM